MAEYLEWNVGWVGCLWKQGGKSLPSVCNIHLSIPQEDTQKLKPWIEGKRDIWQRKRDYYVTIRKHWKKEGNFPKWYSWIEFSPIDVCMYYAECSDCTMQTVRSMNLRRPTARKRLSKNPLDLRNFLKNNLQCTPLKPATLGQPKVAVLSGAACVNRSK